MTATTGQHPAASYFGVTRHRAALALIGGAIVLMLVQFKVIPLYYTPLIIGLTYFAAAGVAGRKGALWAPGFVTTCWGIGVLLGQYKIVTIDSKLNYAIAGLIGIVIGLGFRYAIGLAVGALGLAVAFSVILVHDYVSLPGWVYQGWVFAALLAIWGLWDLRPESRKESATAESGGHESPDRHQESRTLEEPISRNTR